MFNPNLCMECGKPLHGRIDKKFCDTHCKAAFNNKKSREKEAVLLEYNSLIRKNRTILKNLCPVGKTTVRKSELEEMGFDTNYFTTIFPTKNGNVYYFCYEYGYSPNIERSTIQKALIIQKQEYMNRQFNPWSYIK